MKRFDTIDEALNYCFEQIKPSKMDKEEYAKFKLYRNRYRKGELKETAINKILTHFNIKQHCYYTLENPI